MNAKYMIDPCKYCIHNPEIVGNEKNVGLCSCCAHFHDSKFEREPDEEDEKKDK
jgi:hypothetical protein